MNIVNNSALVAAGTTDNVSCNFTGKVPTGPVVVGITVVSGTFKFNVGKTADLADVASYTVGDKLWLTIDPNEARGSALNFKAASALDTFKIHL